MAEPAPVATSDSSHPGSKVASWLSRNGMTVERLSGLAGFDLASAEALVAGKIALTKNMADSLAGLFGTTSGYWTRMQMAYDVLTMNAQAPAANVKTIPAIDEAAVLAESDARAAAQAIPVSANPVPGAVGYDFGILPGASPAGTAATSTADTVMRWAAIVALVALGILVFSWFAGWVSKLVMITAAVVGAGLALLLLIRKMNPTAVR